jgi:tRNA nucleotidyltransferase (CCA-adding enzyme)
MEPSVKPGDELRDAVLGAYPELDAVREAADGLPVYLVGGSVRDLLLGRERTDIDLVVVGDAAGLAARLGAETVEHERFSTAKARLDGHEIDVASARSERYRSPGALPEVEPAATIEADLVRRDFTVNAMAIPLEAEGELIDPHGGFADLGSGTLRVLHPRSLQDDPTRALRAARYAARFGFAPEPRTAELLRDADLGTVSRDRVDADLARLAEEPNAVRGLELLAEWGLVEPRPGGLALAAAVDALLSRPPWSGVAPRGRSLLAAALGSPGGERDLAAADPERPSEGVRLAGRHDPVELALARAMGAGWLDRYVSEWRDVKLEIDGSDLIAAGVAQGPAVGRGLDAALRAKLDGEVEGGEGELQVALRAAGDDDAVA